MSPRVLVPQLVLLKAIALNLQAGSTEGEPTSVVRPASSLFKKTPGIHARILSPIHASAPHVLLYAEMAKPCAAICNCNCLRFTVAENLYN
jgi:hypothetical protein